ncbi:MAG: hypothetical protein AAF367_00325 [Pseudomonadota bacterium]
MLIESAPDIFYVTPHYQAYDIVLARIDVIRASELMPYLERRWRGCATKKAIHAFDAAHNAG